MDGGATRGLRGVGGWYRDRQALPNKPKVEEERNESGFSGTLERGPGTISSVTVIRAARSIQGSREGYIKGNSKVESLLIGPKSCP